MFGRIADVAAAIVTVALATTIFGRSTSAQVINSIGNAFAGSIRAASGR